jgi:hypothetical protein
MKCHFSPKKLMEKYEDQNIFFKQQEMGAAFRAGICLLLTKMSRVLVSILAKSDACEKSKTLSKTPTSNTVTPVSSLTDISSICDEEEQKLFDDADVYEEGYEIITGLFRTTSIGNVIRVNPRIASFSVRPHSV